MRKNIHKLCEKILLVTLSFVITLMNFEVPLSMVATSLYAAMKKEEASINATSIDASATHAYLSDLTWLSATSGWRDSRALRKDINESGNLISLIVDGEETFFLKGVFAHATSTVVYDLEGLPFNTFSAYVGVDASRGSSGNGVQFTISVSNDNQEWTVLKTTGILKGEMNAEKVVLDLQGYRYLKLYAYDNRDQSSDHAVYADAMLYNSETYSPKESSKVEYIKTTSEYDEILSKKTNKEIFASEELTQILLQRTLVKRIGYNILQAYATGEENQANTLKWLFNDYEILKEYLLGGTPVGSYVRSLNVLSSLYTKYASDLEDKDHGDLYLRLMLAISLTHSSDVCFWVSGEHNERVCSDPVERYKVLKQLYLDGLANKVEFETDYFETLTVEQLRWVVDNQLSDEEIPWLNWYSTNTQPVLDDKTMAHNPKGTTKYSNRTKAHSSLNPYTYIAYYQGWNYYDPQYYEEDSHYCATDYRNKNEKGYTRGASCNDEYHLEEFGVGTNTTAKPRLWIVWEEDGVCGALSKTGANLLASYGIPTAVIGQPGHAAYLSPTFTKNEDGTYTTTWGIGNAASGWAASEKGERFPLNWGSKANKWHSYYNVSYIILIQRALDNFDDFEESFMRVLLADVLENDIERKIDTYEEALTIQPYNLDAWYGLIQTYLEDQTKTASDYYTLATRIMENMKEWPLPMVDLLRLIEAEISLDNRALYLNTKQSVLTEMSQVKDGVYLQSGVTRDMAKSLLGQTSDKVVDFSFDGDYPNQLRLVGSYATTPVEIEFSLNYNGERTWTRVPSGSTFIDLSNRIQELDADDDIVVHIVGTSDRDDIKNCFIIDLKEASIPTNLYANEWENKVMGVTSTMEWKVQTSSPFSVFRENEDVSKWTKFSEKLPDLSGNKTILVRNSYTGVTLPGPSVSLNFELDAEYDETRSYIPISRLKATASSNQGGEDPSKAIDGHNRTIWHTKWDGSDNEKWIQIEITDGAEISKLEYLPKQKLKLVWMVKIGM